MMVIPRIITFGLVATSVLLSPSPELSCSPMPGILVMRLDVLDSMKLPASTDLAGFRRNRSLWTSVLNGRSFQRRGRVGAFQQRPVMTRMSKMPMFMIMNGDGGGLE